MGSGRRATHNLTGFRALLNVRCELLLLCFELGALAVELALCLCECTLVLPQPLGGRDCTPEEGFLCNAR